MTVCPSTGLAVRIVRAEKKPEARTPPRVDRPERPQPSPSFGVARPRAAPRVQVGPGAVLDGRYQIEAEAGRLGPALVFHGHHARQSQSVSVRIFQRAVGVEDTLERLRSAARAAATMNHPNILRLFDVGTLEDGAVYVVTERLEGETLADRVRAGGPLSADEFFALARELLAALSYAESRGMVHGGLRTDQVFLARDERGVHAQVMDYGIGTILAEQGEGTLTHSGASLTAPYYMAPELLSGAHPEPNVACDLWSVAAILYETATGMLPFTALNIPALIRKILEESAVPPSRYRRDFPPSFDAVLLTALEKRADARFPTAGRMSQALVDAQVEITRTTPRSGNFALPPDPADHAAARRAPRRTPSSEG